ncbi:cadherin-related family member 3 isoform X4 [Choloepus didactylus]|uniref:cadherin-related family member 3 isoform X4 n=1 Tax=Choloepus didactylus TaxID=27675 RepID=UPI00189D9C6A|nr:cadherin-related family member 3 isoform X4 [Choloepus didactylus]
MHRSKLSNMQEAAILLILLGVLSEGEALHLVHLPATSSVAENSPPETPVHKFSVKLSASLSPVSPGFPLVINSSPLTEAFRVNGLSGTDFEVVTTGREQLDFETGPNIFDLQIYIKDGVGATDLQILTVQVTDVNEPPAFPGNLAKGIELYIAEGTNPGSIYQVEAFDPEDASRNIPLSYYLISSSKSFRMSANGTLYSTTKFDFEAGNSSYYLIVEVRDSRGLKASTTLQVNIVNLNDELPRFTSPRRVFPIREELSPGTIVANISAEDPDDESFTSQLLYSITTVNNYFMINQLTGTIQVAHRLDRDAGELRQNPTISLEVLVKDRPKGGQENRMQITFIVGDINDNPATCTKFTHSILVTERAAKGTLLLDLNKFCFDDDSEAPNNKFNFTTPSGVGSSSRFLQDPAGSGKIVLIGDLDYENSSNLASGNKYSVIIQVQDVTPPYYKNNIYIFILTSPENEFPLIFDRPSYVFDVSEVSPARTRIGQVQATDKDFPQSSIRYSISTGGASLQHPDIFWINPKTGELQLVTKVDYETTSTYILRIQAANSEDMSSVTPRITYWIRRENIYSPSAWYVPFVITLGSILLLGLLVSLVILLVRAIYRHCPCKTAKDKKPLVKKGEMKMAKRAAVVETIQMSTVFDGEAIDPVTGEIYEFNSKTGARKWKDPLTQMPEWKQSSPQVAALHRMAAGEGNGPPRTTNKEEDRLSGKAQAEDAGLGSRNEDGKPGTPKNRHSALTGRASPKPHPGK